MNHSANPLGDGVGGVAAIIVAAGRGERMGAVRNGETTLPKQYRQLGERTVLEHSVLAFAGHARVDRVLVVIHPDDETRYRELALSHEKLLPPVHGGATRQASVLAGLEALEPATPAAVLIHDAARPLVGDTTIEGVIEAVLAHGAAIPGRAVADTLKRANEGGLLTETVPRDRLYAVQTPQGFRFEAILAAHRLARQAKDDHHTDDASVAEAAGMTVHVVDAPATNFKITTMEDLTLAETLLSDGHEAKPAKEPVLADIRTGHGYDVHALVPGGPIVLCGIELDHDRHLSGHSDADVGLHALTDAILGALGQGDIGSHFPPTDPAWRGADSAQFLRHAVTLAADEGARINHVDVTLVCEAPKIGPHRDAMRRRIGELCSIVVERVSVKATTNERLGFAGRQEGIAALATATLCFPGPVKDDQA